MEERSKTRLKGFARLGRIRGIAGRFGRARLGRRVAASRYWVFAGAMTMRWMNGVMVLLVVSAGCGTTEADGSISAAPNIHRIEPSAAGFALFLGLKQFEVAAAATELKTRAVDACPAQDLLARA